MLREASTERLPYSPDQAFLLPPGVKDVLGQDHRCFSLHWVVERVDLGAFVGDYDEEGRPAYTAAKLLMLWLYAYVLGVPPQSGRLEQRGREDLAFRDLAGGAPPDHWILDQS